MVSMEVVKLRTQFQGVVLRILFENKIFYLDSCLKSVLPKTFQRFIKISQQRIQLTQMVPGMSSDKITCFLHFPTDAKQQMLNTELKEIDFNYENVHQICNIMGRAHIWDQILTFGIFHKQLHQLTNDELYNIMKLYSSSQNQHVHNYEWAYIMTKIHIDVNAAKITYLDLCKALEHSNLLEIPPYDWEDIMTDIVLKARSYIRTS
jgi:hypothetical protein